jgi:hypothetical protein
LDSYRPQTVGAPWRWPARFEAAWISENIKPWSTDFGERVELLIIQTGHDVRGLPKFRVPAGRKII